MSQLYTLTEATHALKVDMAQLRYCLLRGAVEGAYRSTSGAWRIPLSPEQLARPKLVTGTVRSLAEVARRTGMSPHGIRHQFIQTGQAIQASDGWIVDLSDEQLDELRATAPTEGTRSYTSAELARSLHLAPRTVRRWVDAGIIPRVTTGKGHTWRIPLSAEDLSRIRAYAEETLCPKNITIPTGDLEPFSAFEVRIEREARSLSSAGALAASLWRSKQVFSLAMAATCTEFSLSGGAILVRNRRKDALTARLLMYALCHYAEVPIMHAADLTGRDRTTISVMYGHAAGREQLTPLVEKYSAKLLPYLRVLSIALFEGCGIQDRFFTPLPPRKGAILDAEQGTTGLLSFLTMRSLGVPRSTFWDIHTYLSGDIFGLAKSIDRAASARGLYALSRDRWLLERLCRVLEGEGHGAQVGRVRSAAGRLGWTRVS